jgi:hypothetical protein
MPRINKIVKNNLEGRCIALMKAGHTTAEIAETLSAEMPEGKKISQPSVARFLKPIRQEEREETHRQVQEYLKKNVESELELLDEIEAFHIGEFRSEDNTARERSDYGLKAARIIETKIKFALTDPASGDSAVHPVDLDEFRNKLNEIGEGCRG